MQKRRKITSTSTTTTTEDHDSLTDFKVLPATKRLPYASNEFK
jgi:hypothetical protein